MGAYVSVKLGKNENKTIIESQGLIFPYLLRETIRGLFELFASHSLPQDNKRAMYLIRHADFMMAESWDLRFGVPLWRNISMKIKENGVIPYFFTEICVLETEDFFKDMKEILSNTKKGEEIVDELISKSKNKITFDKLPSEPQDLDIKTIISDDVNDDEMFTIEELRQLNI